MAPVGRVFPRHSHRGRPLNSVVRRHESMPRGVYRRVIATGSIVWKFPRLKNFKQGLCCNRWEREMWHHWRPLLKWETLCPILFADPLGVVVVMPRANQPVTVADVDAMPDYYPQTTAESKPEDHGRLAGRVVSLDYGLPDRGMVEHQRTYYSTKAGSPAQVLSDV